MNESMDGSDQSLSEETGKVKERLNYIRFLTVYKHQVTNYQYKNKYSYSEYPVKQTWSNKTTVHHLLLWKLQEKALICIFWRENNSNYKSCIWLPNVFYNIQSAWTNTLEDKLHCGNLPPGDVLPLGFSKALESYKKSLQKELVFLRVMALKRAFFPV